MASVRALSAANSVGAIEPSLLQAAFNFPGQDDYLNSRELFLQSLSSNGRYKYSRYGGLPLRYAGGKSLAVGHIVEHLPAKLPRLISPFIGGGSVEIACARELRVPVMAFDIFAILTNYWQVQLSSPRELATKISHWQPNKSDYKLVKNRLKQHWDGGALIENALDLAAHYWFNHNLSYGPGFLGWMSKIYEQPDRFTRLLQKVANFRCPDLQVEQADFACALLEHKRDFLYCDPPYYLDGDSQMFRGIYPQRNFPVHHNKFDHSKLRDLLHSHNGGFILSYNDCQTIREWYSDFSIIEVRWQYTLGQGETRLGKNRIEKGIDHVKKSHELLIVKDGAVGDG